MWVHGVSREEWKGNTVASETWKDIVRTNSKDECEDKKQKAWELMNGREAIGPIVATKAYDSVTFRIDEVKGTSPVTTVVRFSCLPASQNPRS